MNHLDHEERTLSNSIEKGEWRSVTNLKKEMEMAKDYAKATLKKDHRMSIRTAKKDLAALKIRALEEGIPNQNLVSSILHKYLSGRLVEN
jgi:predicted DNA binding CopG/RHH family protein